MAQTDVIWGDHLEDARKLISQALRDAGARKVTGLGDIRLYECPLTWITPETNNILRMVYLARDSSVLYAAGGWSDQPGWFTEAYEIVRTETLQWEKKTSRSSSAQKTSPVTP